VFLAVAVMNMTINITAPAAIAVIANRIHVCCCREFIVLAVNSIHLFIGISSSSIIAMQSSVAHGRAVARKSAYSAAPSLRSYATAGRR
jgi:hypothetical protein